MVSKLFLPQFVFFAQCFVSRRQNDFRHNSITSQIILLVFLALGKNPKFRLKAVLKPSHSMKNYLEVQYNEQTKPYTSYPSKLCQYLADRFRLAAGSVALDAGCGRGEFLRGFKQLGIETHGLDIARFEGKLLDDAQVKTADFEHGRFPYDDETFNFVFSKSVIEHLHNPQNFIEECKRVLKPGGRIIIMTPDWQSHLFVFYGDHTHVQPYIKAGLTRALEMYGFHDVQVELFYQLPVVWRYPKLKAILKPLRAVFPIKKSGGNSFWRWSRELMILGTGVKQA